MDFIGRGSDHFAFFHYYTFGFSPLFFGLVIFLVVITQTASGHIRRLDGFFVVVVPPQSAFFFSIQNGDMFNRSFVKNIRDIASPVLVGDGYFYFFHSNFFSPGTISRMFLFIFLIFFAKNWPMFQETINPTSTFSAASRRSCKIGK